MNFLGGHPAIKPKRRREIYEDVTELSQPGGSFYIMVALSTVIAAYGLLIGSAAVVIGAMLVAPLMGPIFGIALGLTSGNRRLLWTSVQSEVYGVVLAIVVGTLIGLLPFRMPVGAEWLVRTQPTLYDLAIALASGLAGAYALVDERVSPALPGVAIAVAVLPPLAACGLSIAALRWDMAGGALMLFVANFFAIQIAGAIVFSLFGMLRPGRDRPDGDEEEAGIGAFVRRFWISFAVLGVIAWFMTLTLMGLAADQKLSAKIERTLSDQVGAMVGARLSEFDFERQPDGLRITARVLTPRAFEPDQVTPVQEALEAKLDRDVHLIIRSLISRDIDSEGAVFTTEEEARSQKEEARRLEFLRTTSQVISRRLADVPGAELMDVRRSRPNGEITVTAVIRAPEAVTPQQVAEIQQALRDELELSLDLVVRTVLSRDATATGFIYDEAAQMRAEHEALLSTARATLESWLARNAASARLTDVSLDTTNDEWAVTAHILAQGAFSPDEVSQMRTALARELSEDVRLTVRYSLGGEVSAAAEAGGE